MVLVSLNLNESYAYHQYRIHMNIIHKLQNGCFRD